MKRRFHHVLMVALALGLCHLRAATAAADNDRARAEVDGLLGPFREAADRHLRTLDERVRELAFKILPVATELSNSWSTPGTIPRTAVIGRAHWCAARDSSVTVQAAEHGNQFAAIPHPLGKRVFQSPLVAVRELREAFPLDLYKPPLKEALDALALRDSTPQYQQVLKMAGDMATEWQERGPGPWFNRALDERLEAQYPQNAEMQRRAHDAVLQALGWATPQVHPPQTEPEFIRYDAARGRVIEATLAAHSVTHMPSRASDLWVAVPDFANAEYVAVHSILRPDADAKTPQEVADRLAVVHHGTELRGGIAELAGEVASRMLEDKKIPLTLWLSGEGFSENDARTSAATLSDELGGRPVVAQHNDLIITSAGGKAHLPDFPKDWPNTSNLNQLVLWGSP